MFLVMQLQPADKPGQGYTPDLSGLVAAALTEVLQDQLQHARQAQLAGPQLPAGSLVPEGGDSLVWVDLLRSYCPLGQHPLDTA